MDFEQLMIRISVVDAEVEVQLLRMNDDETMTELCIEDVPPQFITVLMDQANLYLQKEIRFAEFWKNRKVIR